MNAVLHQWDALLEQFRKLGGIADNIRVGDGPRGRGLFAINPTRECRIVVPPHLLIDIKDVDFRGGRLLVKSGTSVDRGAAHFFESFQEQFGFGAGSFDHCALIQQARHNLPPSVQAHLFAGNVLTELTQEDVFQYFLTTRRINNKLMPVLELVNHSSAYAGFRKTEAGGYMIAGSFVDEILASYSPADTWRIFDQYGFSCYTPIALANPGARKLRELTLGLGLDFEKTHKVDGLVAPLVARQGDVLVFSYLELANRQNPDLPKYLFKRLMESCNVPEPEQLFDMIANTNRSWFKRLLELLQNHEGAYIEEVRKAARIQLETLAFCTGTRQTAEETLPLN